MNSQFMMGRIMRIVVIFIVILSPEFLQAELLTDYLKSDRLQLDRDSIDCCPGQYAYDLLYGLRDENGKIVGWDDPLVGYIENNPPTSVAHKLGRGLSLGALPEVKIAGGIWKALNSGKNVVRVTEKILKFRGDEAIIHFEKHGRSLMNALGKSSYNLKNYVDDANHIVKNGTYIAELNGYVKLIGGQGSAKYGFVGLNRGAENILTFHIKTAKELAKKVPIMFDY